jgi:hypothetical protein
MATIYVKARPGRVAYNEGRKISNDEFVPVSDTPYVRRLINHWEDVELQGEMASRQRPTGGGRATGPRPDSPTESPKPARE